MKKELVFVIVFSSTFLLLMIGLFILPYTLNQPERFVDDYVTNVIDGDTFQYYDLDTQTFEIVRLLCVDTPEDYEEGYLEAKYYLEDLVLGKQIVLVPSNLSNDRDKYGRQLRYVYVKDTFVNQKLIEDNYGELLVIPPEDCDLVY